MLAVGALGFGPIELLLVVMIVAIVFGVGRLSEVGGAIGRSIRDFRKEARESKGQNPEASQES